MLVPEALWRVDQFLGPFSVFENGVQALQLIIIWARSFRILF